MANSIMDGATFLVTLSVSLDKKTKTALKKSARMIRDEARRVLGTYDYNWTPLKPATIAGKERGDSPLLETAALRRSIKYSVDPVALVAHVGSDDPKALWHELGTSRIPPRSFLMGAAMHMENEVHHTCGSKLMNWAFSNGSPIEDEPESD